MIWGLMMATSVQLILPAGNSPVVRRIAEVFARVVKERCGVDVIEAGECRVELALAPGIGTEGFRIEDGADGVRVCGNDEAGLLFGVGKLLRTARYGEGSFAPGDWRGVSVPQRAFRAIYFATHFHNFYHDAPIEEVNHYIEDLALWGYNGLSVWFDMHHFTGIDDPEAQGFLERLHSFLYTAKSLGLRTGIMVLANEAYSNSPEELRADWSIGDNGYLEPLSHYHLEVCPSIPEGRGYILRNLEAEFQRFADVDLDFLDIWPYDQGGCTCAACKPWGGNGFVKMAEEVAALFRRYFPGREIILSTWLFERYIKGEWAALHQALGEHSPWVNYVMATQMTIEPFPEYPLTHGVPGGAQLLDFPEISMCGHGPWGGFGCNPFTRELERIWDSSKHILAGGLPYSEGIYEDLNKIAYAQFYWSDQRAADTVREYAAFYFGEEVADDVSQAIAIMERTHIHELQEDNITVHVPETAGMEAEWPLIQAADARMTSYALKNWRWRLIYLRALLDAELAANHLRVNERCFEAFDELTALYHANIAVPGLRPPQRGTTAEWQALWEEANAVK